MSGEHKMLNGRYPLLVAVGVLILAGFFINSLVPRPLKEEDDATPACKRDRMYPYESFNPPRIAVEGTLYTHSRHITKSGDEVFTWVNLASDLTPPEHYQEMLSLDTVLVLTVLKDNASWGADRTFFHYLALVQSFDYPVNKMSLGLMVSDRVTMLDIKKQITDYITRNLKKSTPNPAFSRITLIHTSKDIKLKREERKGDNVQRERRRFLAQLRNRLLFTTLRTEDSVLWIDADVEAIPSKALKRMVKSGKDIVATYTVTRDGSNYDLNTWKGKRIKPNAAEKETIAKGGIFVPRHAEGTEFMSDFATGINEFVEIDSVGGTVLFVKGDAHRDGVVFTTNYVIGAEWEYEGYDGIETEGLCYTAKFQGYQCWGAARLKAIHA